ncbi:phosphate/phosphite/phosphonate ABC transporter substrate-binding protein [Gryllotalpicola reticulitermitis]|uniref:Phosphate/phosphite/phosphonate ABC transporter substrate-binding protein n=1 Tax=Gryllotalpicola reticulitermitis TaxID=1184153 RepID=A0ABV8Q7A1_9MICO
MPFRIRTKVALAAASSIALVALLAGCSTSSASSTKATSEPGKFALNSKTLVVSSLPSDNGSDPNASLDKYLGKETGLTIKYVPTTSYSALIAAGVANQLDVAVFSGATYVTALNKGAKLDVVSAEITSPGLTVPGYYSDPIVANKNASKYQTVSQFKGKKICFVDPTSTSGYFYPLLALKAAGIDITPTGTDASGNPTFKDFTAYFAGTHPKSVEAVANGQCDVGFAEDAESEAKGSGVTVVKDAAKVGDGLGRQLVPGSPVVINDQLPASLKTKLTKILGTVSPTTLKNAGFPPPASEDFYGILPETKSFYDPIYKGCADPTIAKAASAVCG